MPKPQVSFEGAQPEPLAIKLQYRSATSDKVYHLSLEAAGPLYPELWCVNFAFGRRGTTLQTGTKTKTPIPYGEARRIYETVLAAKTGEGYRPFDSSPASSHQAPAVGGSFEGIEPMLCTAIEIRDAERFIHDDRYWMNRKYDGKRVLLYRAGDVVAGSNRKRGRVALPARVARAAREIPGECILDGELVGETYWAFDLLHRFGDDLRFLPLDYRIAHLQLALGALEAEPTLGNIQQAPVASSPSTKRRLFQLLQQKRAEGVVFKDCKSTYRAGRKPTGWPWLKCKFVSTASLIVMCVNQKRSVDLMTVEGRRVGSVTIPPNKEIPQVGTIVETRYLYAYRGGSLFQPVYLGPRDDIEASACVEDQLKYKQEEE